MTPNYSTWSSCSSCLSTSFLEENWRCWTSSFYMQLQTTPVHILNHSLIKPQGQHHPQTAEVPLKCHRTGHSKRWLHCNVLSTNRTGDKVHSCMSPILTLNKPDLIQKCKHSFWSYCAGTKQLTAMTSAHHTPIAPPQNTLGNAVVSFFQIRKTHVKWISKFPWPLINCEEGNQLVSCSTTRAESTLLLLRLESPFRWPLPKTKDTYRDWGQSKHLQTSHTLMRIAWTCFFVVSGNAKWFSRK